MRLCEVCTLEPAVRGKATCQICNAAFARVGKKAQEPRFEDDPRCVAFVRDNPDGAPHEAIAEVLGVTRQAVQQLEASSLRKLKKSSRVSFLGEYLDPSDGPEVYRKLKAATP